MPFFLLRPNFLFRCVRVYLTEGSDFHVMKSPNWSNRILTKRNALKEMTVIIRLSKPILVLIPLNVWNSSKNRTAMTKVWFAIDTNCVWIHISMRAAIKIVHFCGSSIQNQIANLSEYHSEFGTKMTSNQATNQRSFLVAVAAFVDIDKNSICVFYHVLISLHWRVQSKFPLNLTYFCVCRFYIYNFFSSSLF